MPLSIEEVSDRKVLPEYRSEWDTLVLQSREGDLFHTYRWITTWLDAFWGDMSLAFLFVRDAGGRLIGLVPLVPDMRGQLWCRGSLVSPVNDYSTRTSIITVDDYEGVTRAVLEHLRNSRKSVRLAFRTVRSDSWVAEQLPRQAGELNMSAAVFTRPASPYIDLACGRERYFQSRSRHFVHEMRRKQRRIEESGKVKCVTVASVEEVARTMPDVFEIEKNSWKHEMGSAFTSQEPLRRFYQTFAERSAAEGEFRLHLLYLDGRPIAHIYGATFKRTYFALKTSYDSRYFKYSPGTVILHHALEDLFEQGFDRLDLLGDESRWKNELATGAQPQLDVCVFSGNRIRCRMCRQFELKGRPFLENHVYQGGAYRYVEKTFKPFLKKHIPLLVRAKRGLSERFRSWLR